MEEKPCVGDKCDRLKPWQVFAGIGGLIVLACIFGATGLLLG